VVIIDWRYYFTNSKSKNRINAYLIPRDGFKFLCKIDTTTPACYSQTIFMVIDSTLAAFHRVLLGKCFNGANSSNLKLLPY